MIDHLCGPHIPCQGRLIVLPTKMSSNGRTSQFLGLPFEIIHKILSLLSPIELTTCQLINKYLNVIISESLTLQYRVALTLAIAEDNPCSVVPLPQKLEDV